jgi:hypothetical protein
MKNILLAIVAGLLLSFGPCIAVESDPSVKKPALAQQNDSHDSANVTRGLKEALAIGAQKAVLAVSKKDGYFGNQSIRLAVPDGIEQAAAYLDIYGFRSTIDDFVLKMNRAAERAAPRAAGLFADSIRGMTFDNPQRVLNGGDIAATDMLRKTAFEKIQKALLPVVAETTKETGAAQAYRNIQERYEDILPVDTRDISEFEEHVSAGLLNGIFFMLGEEEKKLRKNPEARSTELLREVFSTGVNMQ